MESANIITTATAVKHNATILSDNMIGPGVHINGVGGDCPGKTEMHHDMLCSEIFVEFPPQTGMEGEIQQLYPIHPVIELWRVMTGQEAGRNMEKQITLFDSVGFAIEDFSALRYVRSRVEGSQHSNPLDLLADPDERRDLFGMPLRREAVLTAS